MKLVVHPAVEADRLAALSHAVPGAEWVNASTEAQALAFQPGLLDTFDETDEDVAAAPFPPVDAAEKINAGPVRAAATRRA